MQLLGQIQNTSFFFATYKWAQWDRVLHYTRLKRFARDKHSSLSGPFISYEENEVLWMQLLVQIQNTSFFFATYNLAQ